MKKRLIQLSCIGAMLAVFSFTARLNSDAFSQPKPRFAGVQACAECHRDIVTQQQKTIMAKAMVTAEACQVLREHALLKFQQGKFSYRITRTDNRSTYEVTDGTQTISAPLLYAFGQGLSGQTYVFEYAGKHFESRVSFYQAINGLDITLGHTPEAPPTLIEAAGRVMSLDEARNCFGCHTTNPQLELKDRATQQITVQLNHPLGIRCESCHGPGEAHIVAAKAGKPTASLLKSLGKLDGDDLAQNVCGTCHRSVDDVINMPILSPINNVRFQPYRLFNSRCYSADKRISCTGCHDPHGDSTHETKFYDQKCLSCHKPVIAPDAASETTRMCKVAKQNCVECHMPKVELSGAHFQFTDHRIRIARAGAPFPK